MSARCIERTPRFERELTRLSRKHPSLQTTVDEALQQIVCARRVHDDQIPGIRGYQVFKRRIPLGEKGKQKGARLIYSRDNTRVVALFLYAKAATDDIPIKEISDALRQLDTE